MLEAGARWAIVGTRAALDPAFLGEVCRRFERPHHRRAWTRPTVAWRSTAGPACWSWRRWRSRRDAAAAGAGTIIYTDIARDGTQGGPNVRSTEAVARAAGIPVFASGGVGSLEDIRQLAASRGVDGVIVGRALYTGAVSLRAALAEAR